MNTAKVRGGMNYLKPNKYRVVDKLTTAIEMISEKYGAQECMIDTEDFNRLKAHRWTIKGCGSNLFYVHCAIGNNRTGFNSTIMLHRLVLSFPDGVIDHINGDCFDNRKSNLRVATYSENRRNSSKQVNTKCRFRGVYERKESPGRYRAQIRFNGKIINIGTFKDEIEAAKAYDLFAKKYYGDFAVVNFQE